MPSTNLITWLRSLWPAPDDGQRGEQLAARFLRKQGYRIVARNLRTAAGEIDILAESPDRSTVVVVEVKTTRTASGPMPEMHVNGAKQRKLVKLAVDVTRRYRLTDRPTRFDVVGVTLEGDAGPQLRHHPSAFESHV